MPRSGSPGFELEPNLSPWEDFLSEGICTPQNVKWGICLLPGESLGIQLDDFLSEIVSPPLSYDLLMFTHIFSSVVM